MTQDEAMTIMTKLIRSMNMDLKNLEEAHRALSQRFNNLELKYHAHRHRKSEIDP